MNDFAREGLCRVSEVRWHSAGAASRLAALLVARIFPICSLLAPCHAGASPPSVHNELLRHDTSGGRTMKFGVNTFIWGAMFGPPDFHLLPRIKASGFDGIEVPILDPGAFEAEAVGRELDRMGLNAPPSVFCRVSRVWPRQMPASVNARVIILKHALPPRGTW